MKTRLIIIFAFIGQLCLANMASPYWYGTKASEVFTSRNIDIVKEKIHVVIDKNAQTATYKVEYHIKTDIDGKQVPLLFYALDFKGNFHARVDNKEITLVNLPTIGKELKGTPFETFSRYFDLVCGYNSDSIFEYNEDIINRTPVHLDDLKYFETVLSKGKHIFQIEYIANPGGDRLDWVNKYVFQYSLSPAKYWKSFGSLDITVDTRNIKPKIITNLGQPNNGRLDSIATWHFNKLPNIDIFTISYVPQVSWIARLLITIGPLGLTLILTVILIWSHFLLIKKYRKNNYMKKYSWIVMVGSIINSFLIFYFYVFCSFEFIDAIIGSEASKYHGYEHGVFAILLYPILLPIYMVTMWKIDKAIKTRRSNN